MLRLTKAHPSAGLLCNLAAGDVFTATLRIVRACATFMTGFQAARPPPFRCILGAVHIDPEERAPPSAPLAADIGADRA